MNDSRENPERTAPEGKGDLDAELGPLPGRASAVRLALLAGLALALGVPAALLLVAYFSSGGDFASGVFATILIVFAALSGLVGLVVLLVAGFLLLVFRGQDRNEGEVFGSPAPNEERQARTDLAASLDLRYGWGPALWYMMLFSGAQFARALFARGQGSFGLGALEFIGGALEVLALVLFFFFWAAGYVRLNRAGARFDSFFFVWPLLALAAFFLPVLLL